MLSHEWTIVPLILATAVVDKSQGLLYKDFGVKKESAILGWLLMRGKERILVDTGACGFSKTPEFNRYFSQTPDQNLEAQLGRCNTLKDDITTVINTHLHLGHCGGNVLLKMVEEKLEIAKQFGADYTINSNEYPTPEAGIKRVKELTGGAGADVVMEVVASAPQVVPEGVEMLAVGGTYLTCGLVGPFTTNLSMTPFISKGLKLVGSANYKPSTMPQVLDFMARNMKKYPFDKIISHKFKLEDVEEAYKQMMAGQVVRAAIVFD